MTAVNESLRFTVLAAAGDEPPVADQASVGVIRIERPEVHNAIDDRVIAGLADVVAQLERRPEVRALVLCSAGERTFSAGGDLDYFARLPARGGTAAMADPVQRVLADLYGGPRPLVGAISGDAFGGGCELVTACHLRLAAAHARFSFRQASLGLVTGWGGGVRLLSQLRRGDALRLLLTAETIDAAEALRVGLVDRVVPAGGDVRAEAISLARAIAANDVAAVRGFLSVSRTLDRDGATAAAAEEAATFAALWAGPRFRAALASWSGRRGRAAERESEREGERERQ